MGATGTGVVVGERELSTGSGRVEMGRRAAYGVVTGGSLL